MKISELINTLDHIKIEHGDLDCLLNDEWLDYILITPEEIEVKTINLDCED